ncbi:MFS transporter [Streptomyces sp. NPDC091212]|uniref:MFS transporter n=1 Tax=Streptomyces sp. NPDC091212 TaxID=3155191 RepID=UPI00341D1A69
MSTGSGADSAPAPKSTHDSRTHDSTTHDSPAPGSPIRDGGTGPEATIAEATTPEGTAPDATARDVVTPDVTTSEAPAETAETREAGTGGSGGTFSSLKIRNYRLFATGAVVSNIGTWMSRITQDWLVLSLTGSSAAVGITTALQFLPMLLFGLYGGVIADRYPKRQLLLFTQSAMALCGISLAVLTLSGHVQVWHVYLIAFMLGMVTVIDNPTRQSFVSEMVGPDQLRNAVSLNSANFQSARLIGPAVAGVLITTVGSGWAFMLNGLSFIAPLAGLLLMRQHELHKSVLVPRGKGQLREGLRYVRGRPELIWPIVLVGFVGTFGFNFPIWLTAFAHEIFHGGAGMYAFFNILMAAGSLAGALLSARRRSSRILMLVLAAMGFGLLEILVSVSPSVWLFSLLLLPIGMIGLTVNVSANTSVQMASDPEMRGRVMSLYMMVFVGGTPIGGPLLGWVTDTYGARIGFAAGGVVSLIAAAAVGLVLTRVAGVRLKVDLRGGRPHMAFVPKERELATAA